MQLRGSEILKLLGHLNYIYTCTSLNTLSPFIKKFTSFIIPHDHISHPSSIHPHKSHPHTFRPFELNSDSFNGVFFNKNRGSFRGAGGHSPPLDQISPPLEIASLQSASHVHRASPPLFFINTHFAPPWINF